MRPRISRFSIQRLSSFGISLVPERKKVKPIVRRETGVVLEPSDIALRPLLQIVGTIVPMDGDFLGEFLEVNFVTIAAAIEAEEEDHGTMHDGRDQKRAGRESGRSSQELALGGFAVVRDAIPQ